MSENTKTRKRKRMTEETKQAIRAFEKDVKELIKDRKATFTKNRFQHFPNWMRINAPYPFGEPKEYDSLLRVFYDADEWTRVSGSEWPLTEPYESENIFDLHREIMQLDSYSIVEDYLFSDTQLRYGETFSSSRLSSDLDLFLFFKYHKEYE